MYVFHSNLTCAFHCLRKTLFCAILETFEWESDLNAMELDFCAQRIRGVIVLFRNEVVARSHANVIDTNMGSHDND